MVRKEKLSLIFALGISSVYGLLGSLISLNRYWQYEVFYFDFGIFDKAIWSVSRFSLPIIDHYALGERIIFSDHFSPSIFLLSPFFWLFPFNETLLVIQAVAVAGSGFVLFLIGKDVLKNAYFALALLVIYFLFVGLQNAVITDFHEVTVATVFFMLVFWAITQEKKKLFILFFVLLLGFKESLFLLGMGIAVVIFFTLPKWRKLAVATFFLSLLWGIIAIKLIIPYFSEGVYIYNSELPTNPIKVATAFFDSPVKKETLWYTYRSFGFLPLLSPAFWFLQFQDFLIRFYPPLMNLRWGLAFHYSALTAGIMAVSSVYSLQFLQKKIPTKYLTVFLLVLILNAAFLYRVTLRGPFALGYNGAFYAHTKDFAFLNNAISKIPTDASVMTQNNIAPHFTHQKVWLLLSDNKKYQGEYYRLKNPDYILFDLHDGQNPNNHFGIKDMDILMNNLQTDTSYMLISSTGGQFIFKKR